MDSQLRDIGFAAKDIECVMDCAHKVPSALHEQQDVLYKRGGMSTKIQTFYTRALSTVLEEKSWKDSAVRVI